MGCRDIREKIVRSRGAVKSADQVHSFGESWFFAFTFVRVGLVTVSALFSFALPAQARTLDVLSPAEIDRRAGELQQGPWQGPLSEENEGWHDNCWKSIVSIPVVDPLSQTKRSLDVILIHPDPAKPAPVMIEVPTIRGVSIIDNQFASNFCEMGIATLIANVVESALPEEYPAWGMEDRRNREAILALRAVIDFAHSDERFTPNKVGIMGSSMGGIITSFIAGLESRRLAAIITVVAGGNLPFILSESDNNVVSELRERRMEHDHLETVSDYEMKLRQTLRYDPMHFTSRAEREKILMVVSSGDSKVPSEAQFDLHRAFGSPLDSQYTVGHLGTILGLAYLYFDTVGDFLQTKLDLPMLRRPFVPKPIPDAARAQLNGL